MSQSEAIAALPAAGAKDPSILRNFLVKRVIYPLGSAEDPEAFEALDGDTGAIPEALAWQSLIFWLDPDDTTSAHDGTTVLVTSDGYRYKIPEYAGLILSVLDKDTTAPPGDPDFDDAYLVPEGATGDWSGHNDKVAVFTAHGWKFVVPKIGRILHVEDEDAYYHWASAGEWVAGFGDSLLSTNSVLPENVLGGRVVWIVENQTTDAPPGSPADGVAYIVGPSPSGDWSGHAGKIAIARSDAWLIYAPATGWAAFDKAQGAPYQFLGSAWVSSFGAFVAFSTVFTASGSMTSASSGTAYTYSSATAPTTSQSHRRDDATLAHTARAAGKLLRFTYGSIINPGSNAIVDVAIFRDSEASALDWATMPSGNNTLQFVIAASDAAARTYTIRQYLDGSLSLVVAGTRRRFSVEEAA